MPGGRRRSALSQLRGDRRLGRLNRRLRADRALVSRRARDRDRASTASPRRATRRWRPPTGRSSPTSTTTRSPTPTGSPTSPRRSRPSRYVAAGGPNVPPPGSGRVAQCVANAPGGPTHVLIGDRDAEHIPGCNMAIRKDALQQIGGFDPQFRAAGDDVDACWRLLDAGGQIAFSAGRRRLPPPPPHRARLPAPAARLRQGRGAARAQAPREVQRRRARRLGRAPLRQRLGPAPWRLALARLLRRLGHRLLPAALRPAQRPAAVAAADARVVPGDLGAGGAVGGRHRLVARAARAAAARACTARRWSPTPRSARRGRASNRTTGVLRMRVLTGPALPAAAARAAAAAGSATVSRRGGGAACARSTPPLASTATLLVGMLAGHRGTRTAAVERAAAHEGAVVASGGDWDRWDLSVRGGLLGCARLRLGHRGARRGPAARARALPGRGRDGRRWCCSRCSPALAALAAAGSATAAVIVLAAFAAIVLGRLLYECSVACATVRAALPHAFVDPVRTRIRIRTPSPTARTAPRRRHAMRRASGRAWTSPTWPGRCAAPPRSGSAANGWQALTPLAAARLR